MAFRFGRHRDKDPAPMAASPRRGFLRKLLDGKGAREPQATSRTLSSVSSNRQTTKGPSSDGSSLVSPSDQSLWDRAYEALEKQSPNLTRKYRDLIVGEAQSLETTSVCPQIMPSDNAASNHGVQFDRAQLLVICEKGLVEMEEKKTVFRVGDREFVPKEQIARATELVLQFKDVIGEALKVSPEASIAWAGVCLVLPLLTNPTTADEANRDGFTYVTMRMHYYTALEPLIRPLAQHSTGSDALTQVYNSIVDLFKTILEFQFLSVLRFFKTKFERWAGDVFLPEDWKTKREDIEKLEKIVAENLHQISYLVSAQTLAKLQRTSTASVDALRELMSLSAKHLRVAEDHLDVAKDQLDVANKQFSLQQNEFELRLTEEERKCLQVFRLTSDQKDATYEWYKERVENRIEGTCQWFLNHSNFTKWLAQNSGMLLVSADPGCGKSVLAKYLIDHVLQPTTVCYFFFKDQDQNTVRQTLCALLHQLFSHDPSLIKDHALSEYRKDGAGLVNTTASLWKIFDSVVQDSRSGNVVIVLDALDECAETEFEDLVWHIKPRFFDESLRGHKLKFLMTSRPYNQIMFEFRDLFNAIPSIHIPGEEHSEAISQEVNLVIENRVKALRLSSALETHLTEKLLEVPHRTYLWVHLVFDNLERGDFKRTLKGLDYMIMKLPKNVNEAYEQILEKSKNQDGAQMALAIILAAQRPLTLSEMNVAMNIQEDHRAFSDLDLEDDNDFNLTLRSWCGLFVSIHHGKIYFLHQTAREFLLTDSASSARIQSKLQWHQSVSIHQSHTVLAEKCVLYLALYNSREPEHEPSKDDFLDYAAKYWGFHFRKAEMVENPSVLPMAQNISNPASRSYSRWFDIFWRTEEPWAEVTPKFSKLGVSSYLGHKSVVERILSTNEVDIDPKDTDGQMPLSFAAAEGHEAVVKLLLATGKVDVESKNRYGLTPLSLAAFRGCDAVVKLLLETEKVNIDSKDSLGRTPLSLAAAKGHETVVKLLLATEADINSKNVNGQTPFSFAAEEGHEAVIKLLLATEKVDVDSKDSFGRTPLSRAAARGHEAIIKLLLATEKVDVDSKDSFGRTPLSRAAARGHEAIISLLQAFQAQKFP